MKPETLEQLVARIAELKAQETRLLLTTEFPPAGCRHVAVWREVQSGALVRLRRGLDEARDEFAQRSAQLNLALEFTA